MAPSIANSFSEFTTAVVSIVVGLFSSILAVFQAILALGQNTIEGVFKLGQSFVKLGLDVFQGVFGFATGAFILRGRSTHRSNYCL